MESIPRLALEPRSVYLTTWGRGKRNKLLLCKKSREKAAPEIVIGSKKAHLGEMVAKGSTNLVECSIAVFGQRCCSLKLIS